MRMPLVDQDNRLQAARESKIQEVQITMRSFSTRNGITVLLMTGLLSGLFGCSSCRSGRSASTDAAAGTTLDRGGAGYSPESANVVASYMNDQADELALIASAKTERTGREITITWDSETLFDLDSAMLKPDSEPDLKLMAQVFAKYPDTRLIMTGHTDNEGSEQHNFKLSERRARSVHNFLVDHGVAPSRMSTMGYGELRPVASNGTAEGRRLNRRVEIQIKPGDDLKARALDTEG